jgi:methionyl-tRNA formyltransferase
VAGGEKRTGVTTMRIDAGLDTGDMLLKWETEIGAYENALELGERLAAAGADLLVETLQGLESGNIRPQPQNNAEATLAPILKKEDGLIDWNTQTAHTVFNRGRGFLPWPGIYTYFRGQLFHIWKSRQSETSGGSPGGLRVDKKRLLVNCAEGTALELVEVQIEGRKRVPAESFLNGQRIGENEMLGVRPN